MIHRPNIVVGSHRAIINGLFDGPYTSMAGNMVYTGAHSMITNIHSNRLIFH